MSDIQSSVSQGVVMPVSGQALSLSNALKRGALGGALAVAANLLVYALARFAFGLELLMPPVPPSSEQAPLLPFAVIFASFVPGLAAGGLYWLLSKFIPQYRRVFLIVSVLFLLVSFGAPFSLPVAFATQITLNVMHLVAGVAIIGAITRQA